MTWNWNYSGLGTKDVELFSFVLENKFLLLGSIKLPVNSQNNEASQAAS